jgi:hypothetical protein
MATSKDVDNVHNGYCSIGTNKPAILVPLDIHPATLGGIIDDTEAWCKYDISLSCSGAWDYLWYGGRGRHPKNGGAEEHYALVKMLGIRFELVRIGEAEYWVPRESTNEELGEQCVETVEKSLSPAEVGRMEERGWMTWGAGNGVIIGDN